MNSYMHNKAYFSHYQPTLGRLLMWEVCFVIDSYIYCTLHFLKMFLFCARTCMCNRVMCLVASVCVHICTCTCAYTNIYVAKIIKLFSVSPFEKKPCLYVLYILFVYGIQMPTKSFLMSNESYRQSNLCVFYLRPATECCITVYHT